MKLSIIIPAYNSGERIVKLLHRIHGVNIRGLTKEVIVVDDCSKDDTHQRLKKIKWIKLVHHKRNTGKGGAVRTGFRKATGDIFLIQDDDLEYNPEDIPNLINPILKNKAKVVFGSRRLNRDNTYSSYLYFAGGVLVNKIISLLLGTKISDAITGSKVFTREIYDIMKPIETNGFEIEAEITAKIVKAGIAPYEVPITYTPRTHRDGKNIRWHHAFPLIKTVLKYALLP